jgi:hypothetical protein
MGAIMSMAEQIGENSTRTGIPPRLSHEQLIAAQEQTLNTPRRRYSPGARRVYDRVVEARAQQDNEHECAHLVQEHPEWEHVPFESQFTSDYGRYDSLADVFRQIGHDERVHKQESELDLKNARFS